MATQLLPIASTAASSAEFTINEGSSAVVSLKGTLNSGARMYVEIKDDAGGWNPVGVLLANSGPEKRSAVIGAAGTYRVRRVAGSACGAFRA